MSGRYPSTPVRIPVRLVDGKWEYFYGGGVPVKEGTIADLVVDREKILDQKLLAALKKRTEHKILEQDATLRVVLSVREPIKEGLKELCIVPDHKELSGEYYWAPRPADTRFVEVTVGAARKRFAELRPGQGGGVWLQLEGGRPKAIISSSVNVPPMISKEPLDSINHAFTRLSETFEPWRKSHTGNIYLRVLYQERNGKWYPLQRLRMAAEATEEHALVRERWLELMAMFSRPAK